MENCGNSQDKPQPGSSKTVRFKESDNFEETKTQVDEVVGIMKVNVEKVLVRDTKLLELSCRAEQLENNSAVFDSQAVKLKKKMEWKDTKTEIIIIGSMLLLIVVSVLLIMILKPFSF